VDKDDTGTFVGEQHRRWIVIGGHRTVDLRLVERYFCLFSCFLSLKFIR
jgi:hypothetical protein